MKKSIVRNVQRLILHIIKRRLSHKSLISSSGLFDPQCYKKNIDDKEREKIHSYTEHYLSIGEKKGFNPSPFFNVSFYSMANPEHVYREKSPLLDYIKYGKRYGALTCPAIKQYRPLSLPVWKVADKKNITVIRVAFFSHNLNLEGASIVCKDIAVAMILRANIEPVLFSPEDGILRAEYEKAGIKVQIHKNIKHSNIKSQRQFESFLKSFSDENKLDRYHAVYANTMLSFWAINLSYSLNIPSIFHIHESEPINYHTFPQKFDFTPYALHALKNADHVIFVANNTRDKYKKYTESHHFLVIYNAFSIKKVHVNELLQQSIKKTLNIKKNERIYINVGTVTNRKGQVDLLNALEQLGSKLLLSSHFIFIGDVKNAYSQYLHKKVKQLPLRVRSRVHFIKKTQDVFSYYGIANAFIFTSRIESYPKVIQEAMHFKLPIISTAVDGIPEQLEDKKTALFYTPGDAKSLASLILMLHSDKKLGQSLAEKAYSSLQKMITDKDMMDSYHQLFVNFYHKREVNSRENLSSN